MPYNILVFDNDELVAEHDKIIGFNRWQIDISDDITTNSLNMLTELNDLLNN